MTNKVYRSAMGKNVDLGTIMLQNEHVRAVGNMKVNARGDKLNNANQVVETHSERIQRQNDMTSTNVSHAPVHTSSRKARAEAPATEEPTIPVEEPVVEPIVAAPAPVEPVVTIPAAVVPERPRTILPTPPEVDLKNPVKAPKSPAAEITTESNGLAGAIARTRQIKQELEKTRRQQAQDSGIKKI